eukprot:jgi/Bigna1/140676/aug1.57_g15384
MIRLAHLLSLVTIFSASSYHQHADDAPVQLIVDTDLGFDVDDVGAIAVANYLQDLGKCEILAVIHCTGFYKGIGGADVINTHYNRTVPYMGAYRGPWGGPDAQSAQDKYTSTIESRYPSHVKNYDQVDDEVTAYRKALTSAANNSVVIASIGEPLALRNILKAEPELFAAKVKEIYYMDGGYNFGCGDSKGSGTSPWIGSTKDCDGAAQYVINNVPRHIVQYFTLNGEDERTGSRFQDGCGKGPVKDAYQIYTNYGTRPSWDLIAVYFAVVGAESLFSKANAETTKVGYFGNETYDYSNTSSNMYQVWIDGSHTGDVVYMLDNILCTDPCVGGPTTGGCAGYTPHASHNCWAGHGADDIDGQAPCGTMSLAACEAKCDATQGCGGVVTQAASEGLVDCYRKSNVVIGNCDWAPEFNFYLKN